MQATLAKRPEATAAACDWRSVLEEPGPRFAGGAAARRGGAFVAANIAELKEAGLTAAVPTERGGLGLDEIELADLLRQLAHHGGSTALALSIHTHLVAALAWRWRRDGQTGEQLMRRIAAECMTLVSNGRSNWLDGSSRAVPVEVGGVSVAGPAAAVAQVRSIPGLSDAARPRSFQFRPLVPA